MHTPGQKCPQTYPMSLNPNWSDLEEEEGWNDDRQKEKELQSKSNNIIEPQSP